MTTSGERLAGLEFERKFVIPRTRLEPTLRCLAALTRRDERFPDGIVSSIYYDTPSFRLLHEKIDSHLYKTKVRLRWYEDPSLGPVDETSFLELKSRVGLRRSKRRLSTSLMASFLSAAPLTDPAIQEIPSLLPNDPTVSPRGLAPVLVLRYRRRRYLDPLTGSRISLDTRISIGRTNPRLLAGGAHAVLPQLILEIKNSTGRVPVNLHFLRALDAEATSFSKYHAGFAAPRRLAGTSRLAQTLAQEGNPTMGDTWQQVLEGLENIGNQQMSDIGLAPFLVVLLVALVASLFISYLYLYFYSSRATGSHIHRSFPLLGLSITSIFICIQFSLPLSLGLLGALSIVRFRTPVKEPEEIGFIMLVIAASLACATSNFGFLVVLLAVAVLALLVRRWAPALLDGTAHDGSLILTLSESEYRDKGDDVLSFLERSLSKASLESISRNDRNVVLSFLFRSSNARDLTRLEENLREVATPTDFTVLFNRPGRL